ncbi:MAG: class II aldolase/adducin family protein [Planctomycetaceae bacterium]|nr:class II aldolase/adducin family protein [Planctomycetaceae bacterium]
MASPDILHTITVLSREFGSDSYVRGGGGNTSCKDDTTLFVKPSGTTLGDMTPEKFLPLSRARLNELYTTPFPEDVTAREREVVSFMATTVLPGHDGRPSVEAPLHNIFPQRFVIHTHPAYVNALTCAAGGEAACARLFPDALWMPVVEPGYTLCMRVRDELARYRERFGKPVELLVLANHGVFIAHDEADGMRALYRRVMDALKGEVERAGIAAQPPQPPATLGPDAALVDRIRAIMGDDAAAFASAGPFPVPGGALTPDHIVYCRAALYTGDASEKSLRRFHDRNGYWPRVVAAPGGVYGFGTSAKVADLALELAWDGAMVMWYAEAFGGVKYLEKRFVDFISNWEVESYRQRVVQ